MAAGGENWSLARCVRRRWRPATALPLLLAGLFGAASVQAENSLRSSINKILATPTPTPHKRKKTGSSSAEKASSSPSASAKKKSSSPTPEPEETPAKSEKEASPLPAISKRRKKSSARPTPTETPTPSVESSTPEPSGTPEAEPREEHAHGRTASLTPEAIRDFDRNSPKVQKLLSSALDLTTRNLDYKYGSADPANGGMDCSGFVYYILRQNGLGDVPRDSSGQYVWLRKAGRIEPVVSRKEDSFELEKLKPGDLLFWTGTYAIERDPPITHAMIYLGREKKSGKRVMVGSSDGRTYEGQQRYGVSVFDFQLPRAEKTETGKLRPSFVGYGHLPGLTE